MSQTIWSTIVPSSTSGNQLAQYLNDFKEAMVSSMSGTSRPSELDAGGLWMDTSADPTWTLNVFDGVQDIVLLTIDTTSGIAGSSVAESLFEIIKVSADTASPILSLLKERIINNGQVLSGDYVGTIQMKGNADDLSVPVTVRIRGIATQNYTSTTAGTDLIFEATSTGSVVIAEVMRLKNGKLGLGTTAPSNSLHVVGDGIRSEHQSNDAVGAKLIYRKKRIAGTGQVLSSDVVGVDEYKSTDDSSSEIDVAKVEISATQNHTTTAQGTKYAVSVKKTGTSTLVSKLEIADEILLKELVRVDQQVDSTTTGSLQSLTPTATILKVTNASLVSIQNIVPYSGLLLMLINDTGVSIVIKNNSGGTAANRIITGTADDLDLADQASLWLAYDTDELRFRVIGGSGAGGGYTVGTAQTPANGGTVTISTTKNRQVIPVSGSGGAVILAAAPFGSSAPKDGYEIELICTSDTNTVEIDFTDSAKGCVGPFDKLILSNYQKARFVYIASLDRYYGGKI